MQIQGSRIQNESTAGYWAWSLFRWAFIVQFVAVVFFILYLTLRWYISPIESREFNPALCYNLMLTSTGCAGIVAVGWLFIIHYSPSKAIKVAFCLTPILTCGYAVMNVSNGNPASLAVAAIAFICAVILAFYACWASPRFEYAIKVLSVSTDPTHAKCMALVVVSICASVVYSCYMVSGIGGAMAMRSSLGSFFILLILLSLAWTMQVFKNALQTIISYVNYMKFSSGLDIEARVVFRNMSNQQMGSICMGSVILPITDVVRGLAGAMSLVAGEGDEFLFSCVDCFSGIASKLIMHGNRWAFVHLGVHNYGFVHASTETWEMFRRTGMEQLIDSELTGTFSFLCGITGGVISSLVGGSWALAIYKTYAIEVSIYAFSVGYIICQIAMAWPRACVSAYYVGYAVHPESRQSNTTIPDRIRELQTRLELNNHWETVH